MAAVHNHARMGGRKKGVPNKTTMRAREAIALLVENNVPKMQEWLDQIAKTDGPAAAWRCLQDVMEYHLPKHSRTEVTGEGGGPIRVAQVVWADD